MHSIKPPQDVATIEELAHYLDAVLNLRTIGHDDERIASRIVGLELNDHIDEWQKQDTDIEPILAEASDLEWSNGSHEELAQMWEHIVSHVRKLKERYIK